MCQFGDSSKILEEKEIPFEEALVGYRNWYITNSFNDKEKFLKSINIEFLWPKKEKVVGNPLTENSEGVYAFNNYYNNYYYYYNNNYYNNYYNYYNNYNNYYYNNYYYNNYYNYNICGKSLHFGKIIIYKEGFRSQFAIPTHLMILSNKRWFSNLKTKPFAEHFNKTISDIAIEYDCKVISYNEFTNGKEK